MLFGWSSREEAFPATHSSLKIGVAWSRNKASGPLRPASVIGWRTSVPAGFARGGTASIGRSRRSSGRY